MESQQDRYRRWRLRLNKGGMTTTLFSSIKPEVRPEDREHLNHVAREKGLPSFNDIVGLDHRIKNHKNVLERLLTIALDSAATGVGATSSSSSAPAPKPTIRFTIPTPKPPTPPPTPKRKREEKPKSEPKPKKQKPRSLMEVVDTMDEREGAVSPDIAYGVIPSYIPELEESAPPDLPELPDDLPDIDTSDITGKGRANLEYHALLGHPKAYAMLHRR